MIVHEYRNMRKQKDEGCFIYNTDKEKLDTELREYCKQHRGKQVWVYDMGVKPSKFNLLPEYSLDVALKGMHEVCVMMFYRRVQ